MRKSESPLERIPMDAVLMHDPFNGDTERIAADAKAWNEKMHPCPDKDA